MWHLILLLPLFGLIVFLVMPWEQALIAYLVILLVSGLMYWAILRALRRRPESGAESFIGAEAKVVAKLGPRDEAQYQVKIRGELWGANSHDKLEPGDTVSITSVDRLVLTVKRVDVQT
jgi:membrane protein implicated in regulation of membrane protease activity